MKRLIVPIGVLVIAAALGWLFFGKKAAPQEILFAPQTNSEGSVEVEVTPVNVTEGSSQWRFDIVLNTHSVELDQDVVEVEILKVCLEIGGDKNET